MKNLLSIICLIFIFSGCGYTDRQARERVNQEDAFSEKMAGKQISKIEGLIDERESSYGKIMFTDGTYLILTEQHHQIKTKLGTENEKSE